MMILWMLKFQIIRFVVVIKDSQFKYTTSIGSIAFHLIHKNASSFNTKFLHSSVLSE